jgi:GxxExxY protein
MMQRQMLEPQMDADERRLNEITERVIGCAYTVINTLGHGFLEKVYENALAYELRRCGLVVEQQTSIKVMYDRVVVGDYVADLLVAGQVLVELKTARILDDMHVAQCLNYLKATGIKVCLLLNFGAPKVQIRRIVNQL